MVETIGGRAGAVGVGVLRTRVVPALGARLGGAEHVLLCLPVSRDMVLVSLLTQSRVALQHCPWCSIVYGCFCFMPFFFFSSRRRHTRFKCDWSSDVCSSD